ncbi:MAG: hypothetical protein EBW53_04720, partial [Actinobacteria bacterium]|nr:hypothetical protein [Actinomycetota bacterium]
TPTDTSSIRLAKRNEANIGRQQAIRQRFEFSGLEVGQFARRVLTQVLEVLPRLIRRHPAQ